MTFVACGDDHNLEEEYSVELRNELEDDSSIKTGDGNDLFRKGYYTHLSIDVYSDANILIDQLVFEEFFDTYPNCDCWTRQWLENVFPTTNPNGGYQYLGSYDYCIEALRPEVPFGAICLQD